MNLTDGANFPMPLIKISKTRVNKKRDFPRDKKHCIQEISINIVWNTHIVQILREIRDGKFLFRKKIISIIPKNVVLTYKRIKTNSKYQEPEFYHQLFDE